MAPTFKQSSSQTEGHFFEATEDVLTKIEIDKIKTNPSQPRQHFGVEEIEELAASINEIGLIHPPVVRESDPTTYELISGERRFRALQLLGWTLIPVIIKTVDSLHSAKAALIENIQRVDLNPIEIAIALHDLMRNYQLTQEGIADIIGKKRSTVANFLRLLHLPANLQQWIELGQLSMGHAKALMPLKPYQQTALAHEIIDKGLSVRQAENKSRLLLHHTKSPPARKDPHLDSLKNRLEHHFGTRVLITSDGQSGRISFDYYSFDDLDRLLDILGFHAAD